MLFWNEGFDMDANSMGKEWGISKTKTKIVLLAFLCIIDISVP
jgi:hypothetical protein